MCFRIDRLLSHIPAQRSVKAGSKVGPSVDYLEDSASTFLSTSCFGGLPVAQAILVGLLCWLVGLLSGLLTYHLGLKCCSPRHWKVHGVDQDCLCSRRACCSNSHQLGHETAAGLTCLHRDSNCLPVAVGTTTLKPDNCTCPAHSSRQLAWLRASTGWPAEADRLRFCPTPKSPVLVSGRLTRAARHSSAWLASRHASSADQLRKPSAQQRYSNLGRLTREPGLLKGASGVCGATNNIYQYSIEPTGPTRGHPLQECVSVENSFSEDKEDCLMMALKNANEKSTNLANSTRSSKAKPPDHDEDQAAPEPDLPQSSFRPLPPPPMLPTPGGQSPAIYASLLTHPSDSACLTGVVTTENQHLGTMGLEPVSYTESGFSAQPQEARERLVSSCYHQLALLNPGLQEEQPSSPIATMYSFPDVVGSSDRLYKSLL